MTLPGTSDPEPPDTARLKKRLERERRARLEAETISERVTRELYDERKELKLLQAITVAANQGVAVEDALQTTLDEVCAHTDWPVGHAYLVADDVSGELIPTKIWHLNREAGFETFRAITESRRLPSGIGLPGRVLATRKPAWVEDVTIDANFPRAAHGVALGIRAGFAFPVLAGSEVAAVLEFFSDCPAEPNEALLELMTHVGTQIGRVIERQRANRKLQLQFTRLNLLNQINQAISEWQDSNSLVHVVLRQLEDHLAIDLGIVFAFDAPAGTLTVGTYRWRPELIQANLTMARGVAIPVEQSGLRQAVQGQTVYLPSTTPADTLVLRWLAQAEIGSAVAVPLVAASKAFGVLLVGRQKADAFSSGECEFLRMLSTHVAVASHQARLHANLKNAYEELRQSQQTVMQQERLRALGQMASGIAHDINNTLSPIVGYADLLLGKLTDPTSLKFLARIKTAGEDIGHIVSRLREFYRHRQKSDAVAAVNLNDLVPEVVELTRPRWRDIQQARSIAIRIETDLAPNLPDVVGNASEMREALTNLIFNAADAMPGGGKLTLRTRVHTASGEEAARVFPQQILLEVSDTGMGMDEETRRRCLEPFFTTKSERGGTGLGLAMVYGIVERHEGGIEIESVLGVGTTMRLVFPLRETPPEGHSAPPLAAIVALPLRILYIDDEPLLRELVKSLLDADGHHVQVAADGESGVEAFRRAKDRGETFDVVITDLGMPYMDGRQVAHTVKSASPDTPVVMMTGWGSMMKGSGETVPHVDAIISKPPRQNEIREILHLLHRKKSAAEPPGEKRGD